MSEMNDSSVQPEVQSSDVENSLPVDVVSASTSEKRDEPETLAEPLKPIDDESVSVISNFEEANNLPSESEPDALEDDSFDHDDEQAQKESEYQTLSIEELAAKSNLFVEDVKAEADHFFKVAKEIFDEHDRSRREELLAKFLEENPDSKEVDFSYQKTPHALLFYGNLQKHRILKTKARQLQQKEQTENLNAKKAIIEEIKALTENMDAEPGSLEKLKDLQKKWKEVGNVPHNEREALNMTYRALMDRFYDLKDQENELKELDRRKNLEEKIKLCEKVESLLEMENINQAVNLLNKIHEEFKEIGPVPKEDRETIWNRFKSASDKIYDKKRAFSEEFKKQLQQNMLVKQQLCMEIEQFVSFESDKLKEWNTKTKEILAIQDKWNAVGAIPKEVSKDINKQFWINFKAFFSNKSKFFEAVEANRNQNYQLKVELCEKAESLSLSSDWDATAEELKKLQEEWKTIGPVPEKERDNIYNRFKSAIDSFFERKRNKRNEKDKEFEDNLNRKLAAIKAIKELSLKEGDTLEEFLALKNEFFAVGFVPMKNKNNVSDQFAAAIDDFFEKGKCTTPNKEKVWVQLQKELSDKFPFAAKKIQEKEQNLRRKITSIENDIALWENNLSFFSNSKTADKLRSEFEGKISSSRERLDNLKAQLKALREV
jgi:hypothetical protein